MMMLHNLVLLPDSIKLGLLIIVSLIGGSFLNVVIYRLPSMIINTDTKLNLFLPRSLCITCKKAIAIRHNIPLLSFWVLRGRCYHCKAPIPKRYILVESLFVSLSLLAAYYFGFDSKLLFALFFLGIVLCLFWIDIEHQLLPDCLTLSLLWLGLLANTQSLFVPLENAVLSAAGAYLTLWLFIQLYYLLTHKVGMGHGDFKLFAAFGAWFGWSSLPSILVIASTSGALVGYIYLRKTKQPKETLIPFGPFLVVAGVLTLFGIGL